jgi:hypothetical protein
LEKVALAKGADDLANRPGRNIDQHEGQQYVIGQCPKGFSKYVHDFDIIPFQNKLTTKIFLIGDGLRGMGTVSRDVKAEFE